MPFFGGTHNFSIHGSSFVDILGDRPTSQATTTTTNSDYNNTYIASSVHKANTETYTTTIDGDHNTITLEDSGATGYATTTTNVAPELLQLLPALSRGISTPQSPASILQLSSSIPPTSSAFQNPQASQVSGTTNTTGSHNGYTNSVVTSGNTVHTANNGRQNENVVNVNLSWFVSDESPEAIQRFFPPQSRAAPRSSDSLNLTANAAPPATQSTPQDAVTALQSVPPAHMQELYIELLQKYLQANLAALPPLLTSQAPQQFPPSLSQDTRPSSTTTPRSIQQPPFTTVLQSPPQPIATASPNTTSPSFVSTLLGELRRIPDDSWTPKMLFALKEFVSFIQTEVQRPEDAQIKPPLVLYTIVLTSTITAAFSALFFWYFLTPEKGTGALVFYGQASGST